MALAPARDDRNEDQREGIGGRRTREITRPIEWKV